MRLLCFSLLGILFFIPTTVSAHLPVLLGAEAPQVIHDPERSYAFYDTLSGTSRTYRVSAVEPWSLYLNVLVPLKANPNGKYDAMIINEQTGSIVASLEGRGVVWKPYYEEFGADNYLRGPELRKQMDAGTYAIVVTGDEDVGSYTLALGERETFSIQDGFATVLLIPQIKREFFRVSPVTFLASVLGAGYAVGSTVLGFLLALYVRRLLRKKLSVFSESSLYAKNIGTRDRIVRVALALTFFLLAILTTWHPLLFIVAGFSLYQAFATWCFLFALLGKNTCPT